MRGWVFVVVCMCSVYSGVCIVVCIVVCRLQCTHGQTPNNARAHTHTHTCTCVHVPTTWLHAHTSTRPQLVPGARYETLDGVRTILSGTFFDPSVGGPRAAGYPDLILRAAQDANVSAYYLASLAALTAPSVSNVTQPGRCRCTCYRVQHTHTHTHTDARWSFTMQQ